MDFLIEGIMSVTWQQCVMYAIGALLIWLGIKKEYEPSLLVPMGFGAILVNLPLSPVIKEGSGLTLYIDDLCVDSSFRKKHIKKEIGFGFDPEKAAEAVQFEFRPVGYGRQNFPEIIKASKEAGAEWVVVEQDVPSMGLTSMESIQKSIEYLKTLEL